MRRLALIVCLLIGTVAAHAQFEKGKWFVNPSVTGPVSYTHLTLPTTSYV